MLSLLFKGVGIAALTNWAEIQDDVDNGNVTPDLTVLFVVLAVIIVIAIAVYVLIRLQLNAKKERERLERGMRTGIPHIKSPDSNLPASSLSSLYKQNGKGKK